MLPEERKDNLGLGRSPGESSEALLTRLGSPVCWGEDRSEEWAQSAAAAAKSFQSCPTLCDPIDGSSPGSPVPGIL